MTGAIGIIGGAKLYGRGWRGCCLMGMKLNLRNGGERNESPGRTMKRLPKIFFNTDENGEISYEVDGLRDRVLASLKPKTRYEETIKVYRRNRSMEQNNYLWGVVYKMISDETGYTPDEVHQIMAKEFLSYEKDGKEFVRSTTSLKTAEMEEYLSNVRMFASQHIHLYVPLPNEQDWVNT